MYNKIVNPLTGRKVNINSLLGKQVISNYLSQMGGEGWSGSYSCKGLDKDNCNSQPNNRCKWSDKGNFCRKTQSSSKKRGKRNWSLLKNKKSINSVNIFKKSGKNRELKRKALNNKIKELRQKHHEIENSINLDNNLILGYRSSINEFNKKIRKKNDIIVKNKAFLKKIAKQIKETNTSLDKLSN